MTWDDNMSVQDMKSMLSARLVALEEASVNLSSAVNRYSYEKTIDTFNDVEKLLNEAKDLYVAIEDKYLEQEGKELEQHWNELIEKEEE